MKLRSKVVEISTQKCVLGENPLWCAAESALYWIDVIGLAVLRWDMASQVTRRFTLPKPPASIFINETGSLLVAMRGSLAFMDTTSGDLSALPLVLPPSTNERFNDGRCDHRGHIWISTMDRALKSNIGSLVRVDSRLNTAVSPTHAILGNGVCFSPENDSLYFSDTFERTLYRYELSAGDTTSGDRLGKRHVFARLDGDAGRPDGCTVDGEGCLWSARVGGGRIDRYSPDGRLVDVLELPVSHPTHCTFGGPDLKTLFVTSSRYPPDKPAFANEAAAGALLAYQVDAQGLPEHRFIPKHD